MKGTCFLTLALALLLLHETDANACIEGSDPTAEGTACTEEKCSQPRFTDYQGFAEGVLYACGACADGTLGDTCDECDVVADACNTAPAVDEYQCHSYQFDSTNGIFVAKDELETCTKLTTSGLKCNRPVYTATEAQYTNINGCGPCAGTTKDDGHCKECDTDSCNVIPIVCYQGEARSEASGECDSSATHCSKPNFADYIGYDADVPYACGPCPGETEGSTCTACEGAQDSACNTPATVDEYRCHSYEFDSTNGNFVAKDELETCTKLTTSGLKCNRPVYTATEAQYTNINGCGPCAGTTKDDGHCKECDTDSCNVIPIVCNQGEARSEASGECDSSATKCSKPIFTDYIGYATGVQYACGPCAGETEGSTCSACDGERGAACNTPATVDEFQCHSYQFDSTNEIFVAKDEPEICTKLTTSDLKCNRPVYTATEAQYTNENGCGPCAGTTKDDGNCKECDTASCNVIPIKCLQGAAAAVATTAECTSITATKCSKPIFVDYEGFGEVEYGCGPCPGETKDSTCEECDSTKAAGCNTVTQVADYKCYTFTYNTATSKFDQAEKTCQVSLNGDTTCNQPATKETTQAQYKNTMGCGPCKDTTKADGTCTECKTDLCNNLNGTPQLAASMAFVMLLVIHCLFM